jgi:acetyl esterase/lipase
MRWMSVFLGIIALVLGSRVDAQSRVEKNVVYGRYAGLALLMDVHHPDRPNGHGVVFVAGSGWHASLEYGAAPLNETQVDIWGPPLLQAGYTVFAINHRAAPAFRYPAAADDVARAVRFVRHHAKRFGVSPTPLAGVGGSSGAHLVGLVAMQARGGTADDQDPVNREAATLQAVVLRAGRFDMTTAPAGEAIASFMGVLQRDPADRKLYAAASPITHVGPASPPTLLLHGDSDDVVAFEQSVMMEKALREAKAPVRLVRVSGGEHGPAFGPPGKPHPQLPEIFTEMVTWLDRHLKPGATSAAK